MAVGADHEPLSPAYPPQRDGQIEHGEQQDAGGGRRTDRDVACLDRRGHEEILNSTV